MKVLLTGSNGFVGRKLLHFLVQTGSYTITASSRQADAYPTDGYRFYPCELSSKAEVEKMLQRVQPELIIHTAALSSIPQCEEQPEQARLINVESVKQLTNWCRTQGAKLIQFSTDFVFEGSARSPYTENDSPKPINTYGQTKWEAEQYILQKLSQSLIVRVVVVYGKPLPGQHSNIVELILQKLHAQEPLQLAADQWRTPTYVEDICRAVHQLIQCQETGIYHLCGAEEVSIYELGKHIADLVEVEQPLLEAVQSKPMESYPKRPSYTALAITKAQEELGYRPTPLASYIKRRWAELQNNSQA